MKKPNKLIFLLCAFILTSAIIIIKGDYDNKVDFTGDEWDYQSIAVNSCFGDDFLTTGPIHDIETYRFKNLDQGKITFWERFSGQKAYHRSPFYPLFLIVVYKSFGINPVIVKYIQLLVLLISGLLLIPIANIAWGEKGYYIGYLSFIIFVFLNYRFSEHLMPENWQFLFLALIIISLFNHYKRSTKYSVVLGILLGISCLNKGTTFFLFPLIIISDLIYCRYKDHGHWGNMFFFASGFILITGIWSLNISMQRNQLTYISSQTSEVILDGNNEYCGDGLWHPEWKGIPDSYYNNDKGNKKSELLRVIKFYIKNPASLSNFAGKIKRAYAPLHSFIVLITFSLILMSLKRYPGSESILMREGNLLTKSGLILLFCLATGIGVSMKNLPDPVFFTLFILFCSLCVFFNKKIKETVQIPYEFIIIFLNFLVFTLTFYVCNETYSSRYVKTMEGIFILVSVYLFFEIINKISLYFGLRNQVK
jgi:hypothetical protein